MEGEFDVLISTTIIESGLDIPNANTIIINNANNFGLSDLHKCVDVLVVQIKKLLLFTSPTLLCVNP